MRDSLWSGIQLDSLSMEILKAAIDNESLRELLFKNLDENFFDTIAKKKIFSSLHRMSQANDPISTQLILDRIEMMEKREIRMQAEEELKYVSTLFLDSTSFLALLAAYRSRYICEFLIQYPQDLLDAVGLGFDKTTVSVNDAFRAYYAHGEAAKALRYSGVNRVSNNLKCDFDIKDEFEFSSGLGGFDQLIAISRASVNIIAGDAVSEKESLLLGLYRNACKQQPGNVYIALKTRREVLIADIVASESALNYSELINDSENWKNRDAYLEAMKRSQNYLYGRQSKELRVIENIEMELRKISEINQVRMLCVDSLQNLRSKETFENRSSEITFIMEYLKDLADTFNITIFALSSINRTKGLKLDLFPTVDELMGSAMIAEISDSVIGVLKNGSDELHIKKIKGRSAQDLRNDSTNESNEFEEDLGDNVIALGYIEATKTVL